MGFDIGVGSLEVLFDFLEVWLGGKAVQDNIEISFSEGVGNTEADSA